MSQEFNKALEKSSDFSIRSLFASRSACSFFSFRALSFRDFVELGSRRSFTFSSRHRGQTFTFANRGIWRVASMNLWTPYW